MMQKRVTIQKTVVLDAVRKLRNHATADEVYAFCKNDYPNISKATVYRNLAELSETGEISRIPIPNSPDRYDHLTAGHYHVKCTACGKVDDVKMEYLQGLERKVVDANGFVLMSHNIVFMGLCSDCQKKQN